MRKRIVTAVVASTLLGAAAVSPASADVNAPTPGSVKVSTPTRYDTAVAVSKHTFADGAGAKQQVPLVVVSTGEDWPDGLAGAAVAGNVGGPLLLTYKNTLPPSVRAELVRLNPANVLISGGTGVVSQGVQDAIKAAIPNANIFRDAGKTRYDTAAQLSADLYADGAQTIYIASGDNWADAAGATSPAAVSSGPILLAGAGLPAETKAELLRLASASRTTHVENVIVLGGTSVISASTFDQISAMFGKGTDGYPKTVRVAGANRYETTTKVVDVLWDAATSTPAATAYFVNGLAWPDALTSGAAAAAQDAPVLLTSTSCMPAATKAWHDRNSGSLKSKVWVGGGANISTSGC